MNMPGTLKGNWEWRFTDTMLSGDDKRRLRELTETYERNAPRSFRVDGLA